LHTLIEKKLKQNQEDAAVLIAVVKKDETYRQVEEYLDELAFLAETAGALAQNTSKN
jgi:GTPase